jgi:hypothetical protein
LDEKKQTKLTDVLSADTNRNHTIKKKIKDYVKGVTDE